MQTKTQTQAKPETETKAKPTAKAKPEAKAAANPKAEKPVVTHAHRDAGVSETHYTGLSGYLNANRKTAVKLPNYTRTIAQLTPRTLGCFAAIRETYGTKPFPARGLDNAIVAMLATSGLIARVNGTGADTTDANGVATLADAADNALRFKLTKAGTEHGKAKA